MIGKILGELLLCFLGIQQEVLMEENDVGKVRGGRVLMARLAPKAKVFRDGK